MHPNESEADRLLAEAKGRWSPRSSMFWEGMLWQLQGQAGERPKLNILRGERAPNPYPLATAQHDAWIAGSEAGRLAWQRRLDELEAVK